MIKHLKSAVRIRIIEVQIKEIAFHYAVLLKLKFHSYSKFRSMPHKLVIEFFNHLQISFFNLFLLVSKNKMCVLCDMKCGEFLKVTHYQKWVNLIPVS